MTIEQEAEEMYPCHEHLDGNLVTVSYHSIEHGKRDAYIAGATNRDGWISVNDGLPEKQTLQSYEHVPCLCYTKRDGIVLLMWNCEHLVWDAEDGDDVSSLNEKVLFWQPLPKAPKI